MDEQRSPDMIVLHDADNVATALRDVPAEAPVRVAGTHGPLPELTLQTAIRLGHKAAIRAIPAGEFEVKHGYPIGRATAEIAFGEEILDRIRATAAGELTKAEELGHAEFHI
ncbi:MAG TPA: hypothetical protein VKB09_04315 [Thermomicrobiales bacterium]|nr:hypothetical protein [Thermomicrobiales bacterium]